MKSFKAFALIGLIVSALPCASFAQPLSSWPVRTLVKEGDAYRIENGTLYLNGHYQRTGFSSFDPLNFYTAAELTSALDVRTASVGDVIDANNQGFWEFGSARYASKNGTPLFLPVSPVLKGSSGTKLINVSTRKLVEANGVIIGGFYLQGDAPKSVLVRGIGPAMARFGVSNVMPNPKITVYKGDTPIASNDNWDGAQATRDAFAKVGAFALDAGSLDAALIINLQPGGYTIHVSDANNGGGDVLMEVYELP